jgi:ABC-type branched-subunit amino acid transport system permease subunit
MYLYASAMHVGISGLLRAAYLVAVLAENVEVTNGTGSLRRIIQ